MNKRLLLLSGLLLLPLSASAQVFDCIDCNLGLYDEPALLSTAGDITPFVPKDIYLGVNLASPENGVNAIEFSISGLQVGSNLSVLGVQSVTTPAAAILLGAPGAPADTSATSTQTGGMDIAWGTCIAGSQALLKITLLATAPVTNQVLRVMHKFPPSNWNYGLQHPIMIRCDEPFFNAVRIGGRDYTLSGTGGLGGLVGVEHGTWSGVKSLYR